MQESDNFPLSCDQANKTQQGLLESLLGLTLKLQALDQTDQASDAVERRLQQVHRKLASAVQFNQPYQVTQGDQVYLVSVNPVGVTYQLQQPVSRVLQATA